MFRKLQTKRLRHAEMTEPEIMMEIMIITSEREQGDVQGCKQCAEQENPSVVIALLDAAASGRFHGERMLGREGESGEGSGSPCGMAGVVNRRSGSKISAVSEVP